jgi:hypothetical protein
MNKNNHPTEANRAPFYLAIVRLLRLPPPPALSMTRQRTRRCELPRRRSWPVSASIAGDEKPLRLGGS